MQRKKKENPVLGVLGGGQLGRMLALAFAKWNGELLVLDRPGCPAEGVACRLLPGDFRKEEDVLHIGRQVDVLTVEIEQVHIGALKQLEREGVKVYPQPAVLEVIADKGLQKQFYQARGFPTVPFQLYEDADEIRAAVADGSLPLPFVQKTRRGGYDGRGVHLVVKETDLEKLLPLPSVVEEKVNIALELAVLAARNPSGEVAVYEPVEMHFRPGANLLDYLEAPARPGPHLAKAKKTAIELMEAFDLCGLLAVEFFLTPSGDLLINESAPRPHNSAHHTIEACPCSQFEQHLRAVLDLPLGDTRLLRPARMQNILGPENYTGPLFWRHYEDLLKDSRAHLHLYGKAESRPFRKMGHVTFLHAKSDEPGF